MSQPDLISLKGTFALLLPLFCFACAGTVTPPDTTPVYADDATAGVSSIEVEHASVSDPEVKTIEGEQPPDQEEAPAAKAPSEEAPAAPAPTEEAQAAPEDIPPAKKKEPAAPNEM